MTLTCPTVTVTGPPKCVPNWICEQPLNGYESDGCGNRQLSSACNPPTPANITAVSTDLSTENLGYEVGMSVTFHVTWKNTGQAIGTFVPAVTVNGQTVYSNEAGNASQILAGGASAQYTFTFSPGTVAAGTSATFSVCFVPN